MRVPARHNGHSVASAASEPIATSAPVRAPRSTSCCPYVAKAAIPADAAFVDRAVADDTPAARTGAPASANARAVPGATTKASPADTAEGSVTPGAIWTAGLNGCERWAVDPTRLECAPLPSGTRTLALFGTMLAAEGEAAAPGALLIAPAGVLAAGCALAGAGVGAPAVAAVGCGRDSGCGCDSGCSAG